MQYGPVYLVVYLWVLSFLDFQIKSALEKKSRIIKKSAYWILVLMHQRKVRCSVFK